MVTARASVLTSGRRGNERPAPAGSATATRFDAGFRRGSGRDVVCVSTTGLFLRTAHIFLVFSFNFLGHPLGLFRRIFFADLWNVVGRLAATRSRNHQSHQEQDCQDMFHEKNPQLRRDEKQDQAKESPPGRIYTHDPITKRRHDPAGEYQHT